MASFFSESEGSDGHTERNDADSRVDLGLGTVLSSDNEDAPVPQAPESPARVRRGSMRRSRPQHPTIQVRSSASTASSSSSPSARGQGPKPHAPEQGTLREQTTHKLEEQVESLSAEMRELRQENEYLGEKSEQIQEQMEAREQCWSSQQQQREAKIKASWEDERVQRDHLTRERWRMAREDERNALQREVVQQVHRARNILSHQGSALVRRSEHLASENVKLEEQAHSQAVKHESQQQLVAELREAVLHAENRQVQLEEQASVADKRYQEAEVQRKQVSVVEAARFESVVAELRSELDLVDRNGRKAEAAELRYARVELAQVRCEKYTGEVAEVRCEKYTGEVRCEKYTGEARGNKRMCDACLSKDGQPVTWPRQDVLAQGSAAVLSALLKQLQSVCQDRVSAEGKTHTIGVKRKAIRALDRQTQKLEQANGEWASHLVEQGLASQEWALLLSQGSKREDARSSPGTAGHRELGQQLLGRPMCALELQRTAERLGRLQAQLQVLCQS